MKLLSRSTFSFNISTACRILFGFYCPPTKLREGNVFGHVLSFCSGGGTHVSITYDELQDAIPGLSRPPPNRPHCTCTSLLVTSGAQVW